MFVLYIMLQHPKQHHETLKETSSINTTFQSPKMYFGQFEKIYVRRM